MFFELFSSMSSRQEIVCTFLALLELIKIRQIDVLQKERFGDMVIEAAEEAEEAEEEPDMFAGLEQEDSDE
jgi:segregation and condensation protein A